MSQYMFFMLFLASYKLFRNRKNFKVQYDFFYAAEHTTPSSISEMKILSKA